VAVNPETKMLINRVDTLVKSVDRSSAGAAGKLITDLESTLVKITVILERAWKFCGSQPKNDAAFEGFMEVLGCYERGRTAVDVYRGRRSTHGNVS
jgi:hypothetical protein